MLLIALILGISVGVGLGTWLIVSCERRGQTESQRSKYGPPYQDGLAATTILAILGGVALLAFLIIMTPLTVSSARRMEATYNQNIHLYAWAVQEIEEGVLTHSPVEEDRSLFFESANLKQIESFSKIVNDTRVDISNYNSQLRSHRYWQDSKWFGWFWINVSDQIDYITPADLK